jgi:hypothetical protein
VTALAVAAVSLALGGLPGAQVAATLRAEAAAFNARDFAALWKLHTPRFRATCNRTRYIAAERRFRTRAGRLTVKQIRVTVFSTGRAFADYILIAQSGQRAHNYGDVYAKVGTRWLDDLDRRGTAGCEY